jgi:uncharacterized protein with HEPN domain
MRPDRLYLEDIVSVAQSVAAFIDDRDAVAFAAEP